MKNTTKKRFGLKTAALLCLLWAFVIPSCRTIQYVPIETDTEVHVKDSTIYNYIDSIRIHEATRYKDLAWLGDTLQIEGQRSRMWAVADTTKEVLLGGLEEDKVEEHSKIIYKDRILVKDSIRTVEKPVPVEVIKEKKIYPKWMVILSILGITLSCFFLFKVYLRIKKTDLSRFIKK